jgi:hypothetical protein
MALAIFLEHVEFSRHDRHVGAVTWILGFIGIRRSRMAEIGVAQMMCRAVGEFGVYGSSLGLILIFNINTSACAS